MLNQWRLSDDLSGRLPCALGKNDLQSDTIGKDGWPKGEGMWADGREQDAWDRRHHERPARCKGIGGGARRGGNDDAVGLGRRDERII